MRLWHESLIPHLPRQWLLGQHRECCALRGLGWGKKHSTVDYVFEHSPARLAAYHRKVIDEMWKRGYCPNLMWEDIYYRGKNCADWNRDGSFVGYDSPIYPEHDDRYLQECVENLRGKGINIAT